jgi:hypothetical protein
MIAGSGSVITDVIHLNMKISLFQLLATLLLCSLVVATILATLKNQSLQNLLEDFERQGGPIQIDDPSLVYTRVLNCDIPNCWRVRVYLPDTSDLHIAFGARTAGDPAEFIPVLVTGVKAGNQILTFGFREVDGEHMVFVTSSYSIPFTQTPIELDHPIFKMSNLNTTTITDPAHYPHFELTSHSQDSKTVRLIEVPTTGTTILNPGNIDGVAFWITNAETYIAERENVSLLLDDGG